MIKSDDLETCKKAKQDGATIFRIDYYNHKTRGGQEVEFESLIPTKKPNWTAQMGYLVDRSSEFWQRRTLGEKIMQMP